MNHSFDNMRSIVCRDTDIKHRGVVTDIGGQERTLYVAPADPKAGGYTGYFLRRDFKTEIQVFVLKLRLRPGTRRQRCGSRVVDRLVKSVSCFVVDADLKSYFDRIPHDRLIERLEARIGDGRVLDLVQAWLNQEIIAECGRWTPAGGTPQGAVNGPLLANLYLHPLDELMAARDLSMVRYADFVVLCDSMEKA